ncbi:MAG: VWA domain-containing protein [Gammaproteobacteria bacterium]|nr:VWA domain-containing protein [Gammaproteobacteria bacterium]
MNDLLTDFHFLRPYWLIALLPAVFLIAGLWQRRAKGTTWEKVIDPALISHLLRQPDTSPSANPLYLLGLGWLIAALALAGPVWEKAPQPILEKEDALIIILDLTWSMHASDAAPTRLVSARRKLTDLLRTRKEGVTGLIVFAGDAHTVAPLTDDTNTIISMLPALTPEIMPAPGSRLAPAIELSHNLFAAAGISSGRILVLTDEIRDRAETAKAVNLKGNQFTLSILAIGTPLGAPITTENVPGGGGYLKDPSGNLIIPEVNLDELLEFAQLINARFARLTLTDDDLDYLLAQQPDLSDAIFREVERNFDLWKERGPYLLLLLLPLAASAFRRGWLWMPLLILITPAKPVYADWWQDIWLTQDQQGKRAYENNDHTRASQLFSDPAWKATAAYRNGDYAAASELYENHDPGLNRYNLGNALAKQGKLKEAIDSYEQALTSNPGNEDAAFNKQLVEELLQQQQQQQQQSDQDQDQESDEEQQNQNQDQSEQGSESSGDEQDPAEQNTGEETDQQNESEQQDDTDPSEQEQQQATEEEMQQALAEENELDAEEKQAMQQWLRRVPDDPGGLLRRKFERQFEDRVREGKITRKDYERNW